MIPADGTNCEVTVHAGGMKDGDVVVFATSFGTWTGENAVKEETLTEDGEDIKLNLFSNEAGVASIQVYDKENPGTSDTVHIEFFNPESEANSISVEASKSNMLPSTSETEYSITVTAEVLAVGNAPVGNARVNFSLSNSTGGGEYLSPISVVTDSAGIAETTFTSGTRGTGSEEDNAVIITASVATPNGSSGTAEDTVPVVIHEEAANVTIGFATEISSNEDNTQYLLPVSVLVADVNGNPVGGKTVSLSLRPSQFRCGYWKKGDKEWSVVWDNPCDGEDDPGTPPFEFINEDLNGNAYLDKDDPNYNDLHDPGDEDTDRSEDKLDAYTAGSYYENKFPDYFPGYTINDKIPGLGDETLTPGQSSAGTIPNSVETDENGVASFTIRYQKEYAVWVEAQLTATSTVFGTENITTSRKWLPTMADEEELIANTFPKSPFNKLSCGTAQQ